VLRVLALEPYYGGSHRAFLDGWQAQSRHRIETLTMPARKWKWRMRGAALAMHPDVLARRGGFEALFVSDFVDLAALAGMRPDALGAVPRVAYFHENQLTYPVASEDERDYQFGFTNVTTCLAADSVLFNSRYHRGSFLAAADELLRRMPDEVPEGVPERIRGRSRVVPVGVDLASIDAGRASASPRNGPLTVLWNHRWEYDKGADEFFGLMMELADEGRPFELVVTGERFRTAPPVFEEARERLAGRLRQFGYVASRAEYCRLLLESDVVVSTAQQEFFGISVVEAAYAGCAPLLPNRLSYPELLPAERHAACLYEDAEDLKQRLTAWIEEPEAARSLDVSADVARFGWDRVGPMLDEAVASAGGGAGHG
jgi:glycosyltransferase involved in cell wall biosynthesis